MTSLGRALAARRQAGGHQARDTASCKLGVGHGGRQVLAEAAILALLIAGHAQAFAAALTSPAAPAERAAVVVQLGLMLAGLTVMLLCPAFYLHCRTAIVLAVRLSIYLPARARGLGSGSGAARALDHPATPGTWGALLDAERVLLGTRVQLIALQGLLFPLESTALQLLVQSVQVWLTWTDTCGSQLLSDPLTLERQGGLAGLLDLQAALASAVVPTAASYFSPGRSASPQERCCIVVLWLKLVGGIALPTLLPAEWAAAKAPAAVHTPPPTLQRRLFSAAVVAGACWMVAGAGTCAAA